METAEAAQWPATLTVVRRQIPHFFFHIYIANVWIVRQLLRIVVQCPGYFLRTLLYKEASGDVMQQGYRTGLLKQKRFNEWVNKPELALSQDRAMGQNLWNTLKYIEIHWNTLKYIDILDFYGMNTTWTMVFTTYFTIHFHPFTRVRSRSCWQMKWSWTNCHSPVSWPWCCSTLAEMGFVGLNMT